MSGGTRERLAGLFQKRPVLDMQDLLHAFPGRSQRSIIRDLVSIGYLASYNHAGRFYTLAGTPQFDEDGLWQHQGILFSRHGTLKATVRHLVQTSDAGSAEARTFPAGVTRKDQPRGRGATGGINLLTCLIDSGMLYYVMDLAVCRKRQLGEGLSPIIYYP